MVRLIVVSSQKLRKRIFTICVWSLGWCLLPTVQNAKNPGLKSGMRTAVYSVKKPDLEQSTAWLNTSNVLTNYKDAKEVWTAWFCLWVIFALSLWHEKHLKSHNPTSFQQTFVEGKDLFLMQELSLVKYPFPLNMWELK